MRKVIKPGGSIEQMSETVGGVTNHFARISMTWYGDGSQTEKDTYLQSNTYYDMSDNLSISFKVRLTDQTDGNMNLNFRHDGAAEDGTLTFIGFDNGRVKYLSSFDKSVQAEEEFPISDTWTEFNITVDKKADTLTVSREGVQKAALYNLSSNPKFARFNFERVAIRAHGFIDTEAGATFGIDVDDFWIVKNESVDSRFFIRGSKVYLQVDDEMILTNKLKKGQLSIQTDIENLTAQQESAVMYAAIYDADGKLAQIEVSDELVLPAEQITHIELPMTVESVSDGQFLKVYLFNSRQGIMPISLSEEYEKSLTEPFASEIIYDVSQNREQGEHPRILLDSDKLAQLRRDCIEDPIEPYKTWYEKVKSRANGQLYAGPFEHDDADELRLQSARSVESKLMQLSFIYMMEQDDTYMDAVFEEILNTSGYKQLEDGTYVKDETSDWVDWNPGHFLDTSAISVGYGLAYDWGYTYWSRPENAQKAEILKQTLADFGLNAANQAYDKVSEATYWWTETDNNWSMVCNGGVGLAALALIDEPEYTELCGDVVEKGLRAIERCIGHFAPDGAWFEGVGYWSYTVEYLCNYFGSLLSAAGTDYDYLNIEGIDKTGYFPIAMMGIRNTTFNLNDAGESTISAPEFFFLAKQFNDTTLAKYHYYQLTELGYSPTLKDLLWYEPSLVGDVSDLAEGMQTDFKFADTEVATFRNAYFDQNGVFAGIHGGRNGINHGNIDAGQFIYEALGERWAIDLGGDAYNLFGYFDNGDKEKSRWGYYRNRGEGHNTIIINPDALADQPLGPTAPITGFFADDNVGIGIVDMQSIYEEETNSAQRGIYLDKNNFGMIVQDELEFKEAGGNNLYWFMHTKADIELVDEGRSAILTQNGKRLWVGILEGDVAFEVMPATPLPTSPNPDTWEENLANDGSSTNPQKQNANTGIQKLAIHDTDAGGSYRISVYMVPLEDGQNLPQNTPTVTPIDTWIAQ